jgi:hypothetical protein
MKVILSVQIYKDLQDDMDILKKWKPSMMITECIGGSCILAFTIQTEILKLSFFSPPDIL